MTGFGASARAGDGYRFVVEASSVNRKQPEVALSLPRFLEGFEPGLKKLVASRISRGRVMVKVQAEFSESEAPFAPRIQEGVARAYFERASEIQKDLGVESSLSMDALLRLPGVVEPVEPALELEAMRPNLELAVSDAIAQLALSREMEGASLAGELEFRIANLAQFLNGVVERAPKVLENYRESLRERIRLLGVEVEMDDERLLKEVVVFADRSDISEEIGRLRSHFLQFQTYLASDQPVGRALDFLAQEMNREINTIGSKANDSRISQEVVAMKTELERFREQAQNIE